MRNESLFAICTIGLALVAAFAEALVRVSKMTFGDLRSAALEKFSFDRMIARTRRVYEELKAKSERPSDAGKIVV